jgi:hypothetical protein
MPCEPLVEELVSPLSIPGCRIFGSAIKRKTVAIWRCKGGNHAIWGRLDELAKRARREYIGRNASRDGKCYTIVGSIS